jgi:hypothetical protein
LLLGILAIVPVIRSQNGYVGALDFALMLVLVALVTITVFIAGLLTRKEEIGFCLLLAALILPIGFCGSGLISKQFQIGAYREEPMIPIPVLDRGSTISGTACSVKVEELSSLNGKTELDDCDLKRNAKTLNGKIVRLKSTYWMSRPHGPVLVSNPCDQTTSTVEPISVSFANPGDEDFILETLQANPANIEAIGRFYITDPSRKSDSIEDNSRYHFEIFCLENATPSNKRW